MRRVARNGNAGIRSALHISVVDDLDADLVENAIWFRNIHALSVRVLGSRSANQMNVRIVEPGIPFQNQNQVLDDC